MDQIVIGLLQAILGELQQLNRALLGPEGPPPPCTHPPEQRSDARISATFWKCNGCGYVYDNERAHAAI